MSKTAKKNNERALVLHLACQNDASRRDPEYALDEACSLSLALPKIELVCAKIIFFSKRHAGLLFGQGKINEILEFIVARNISLVLIDGFITAIQQRNLETRWNVKILDRTGLIIEIFSARAQTREGILQVELAALSYQRTRMVRAWTHLERQRGGLGFIGGPGETQIESDRRAIDNKKKRLANQLARARKTRLLHRKSRKKIPLPTIALVGYTNAGKSTLFNRLTGENISAKDMLFTTLDPTMRAIKLFHGEKAILSDTVGFISDLPTHLIAAFRATLEEVLEADLIIHIRNISHPETNAQAKNVKTILKSLGYSEKRPIIELWNKVDLLNTEDKIFLEKKALNTKNTLLLSALEDKNFSPLLEKISLVLRPHMFQEKILLPNNFGRARAWLHERGLVKDENFSEHHWKMNVFWSQQQRAEFHKFFNLPKRSALWQKARNTKNTGLSTFRIG